MYIMYECAGLQAGFNNTVLYKSPQAYVPSYAKAQCTVGTNPRLKSLVIDAKPAQADLVGEVADRKQYFFHYRTFC